MSRHPLQNRRVVVTGVGAVTPLGLTSEESWKNALAGKSGIAPITRFNAEKYDVKFAGEVKNFNADHVIPRKDQKKMDLFIHFAMAATDEALKNAKLEITPEIGERTGAIIGSGMGGLPAIEEQHSKVLEKGPDRISPFFIPMVITNMASGQITIKYGMNGPNYCVTSACASGAHAIGEAANYIRLGHCDVMVAGGTEATVCPMAIGGFSAMRALSTRNDAPEKASRPFDKDRDGFVLAEGAGIVVLEDYEFAKKRGANIICEVTGYGVSSDAHHMTNPAPGGAGAARAMRMALKDSGLEASSIDYVNAHGTSTPVGDEHETQAIKSVLGTASLVSSTKSMMGHALGAAGAIEAVFCILALRDQKVPPTINLENPSEGCDLDYVAHEMRNVKLNHVLNNSFGFGGTNACLVMSKI
jgi:3-oxoacyl-[acyl-carrier-protein] synthase II